MPKPHPLSYNGAESLEQMLSARFSASPHPDTLYYEVLDLPLPEFEKLKVLKVRPPLWPGGCLVLIPIPAA